MSLTGARQFRTEVRSEVSRCQIDRGHERDPCRRCTGPCASPAHLLQGFCKSNLLEQRRMEKIRACKVAWEIKFK